MEHKQDKYGCIDENCKEHYPTIPRKSIIAEFDAIEIRTEGEEKDHISRTELIGEIEKKRFDDTKTMLIREESGYNQALDDIIKIIKGKN